MMILEEAMNRWLRQKDDHLQEWDDRVCQKEDLTTEYRSQLSGESRNWALALTR